ncbi:MAG: dihydrodipicolinate synthase family protein [Pseudolabrys sp.]|jgi:dihydrodipicolinate synthase/N-acetylneuraminate lyase
MQNSRELNGVIPVVQTPVHEDGSIDIDGIGRLIRFLADAGVGGFWVLGTGSEDMNLTFEKRLTVARAITKANAGKLPLILGAGFFCMDDIRAFMDATKDLTFDAYHVMPYHPVMGLDGVDKFYRDLADYAPKPLWMYTSGNWCRYFPPEFVGRLKDHPNIAGIKFSSSRTTDQIKVIGMAEPGFQVITAVATQFIMVLSVGVAGSTTSLAGALPEPLIEIYELHKVGRQKEAVAAQHRFNAFQARLPKRAKEWNFLTGAHEKYVLSLRGICKPCMTSYYTELTESEQAEMRAALEEFGYAAYLKEAA